MHHAADAVDEDHAGAQAIEDIGEACSFGLPEIDGLADQIAAPDMRHDQRHPPAHFVVDHAARLVPHHAEKRATRRGFLDHRARHVDPAMRPRPLAVKAAAAKFVVGHDIRGAHDLRDAE